METPQHDQIELARQAVKTALEENECELSVTVRDNLGCDITRHLMESGAMIAIQIAPASKKPKQPEQPNPIEPVAQPGPDGKKNNPTKGAIHG